ncbi:MAG: helix-turn-helix transcriptional regulator [Oscillospiraceae bacterium]|nr:helix-turn-helix transcriptional regulator [Oscillospiraceae bacterium]
MNRIKELRIESGLTQEQLADRLVLGRSSVGNYETESRQLTPGLIRQFCSFFGCTADYLLCMSDRRTAQISDFDAALLAAYYAADQHGRDIVDLTLQPYFEQETSSASQSAQGGD